MPASLIGCKAIWPWKAEPYRLWGLLDMRRLSVAIINASLKLSTTKGALAFSLDGTADPADTRRDVANAIEEFIVECRELPLSNEFFESAQNLKSNVMKADWGVLPLIDLIYQLEQMFIKALSNHLFFAVPPERKEIYLDPHKWFGEQALAQFEDIYRDVRDACQCFALDQWTAAVFHAMRILEHGLHSLAGRLNILSPAMELENWKTIIDQIEKAIRGLEALPKSQSKSDELTFYSAAAVEFRYFKDAWRNHVSHSRTHYDEQDATTVLRHVRDFMQHLASFPGSGGGTL